MSAPLFYKLKYADTDIYLELIDFYYFTIPGEEHESVMLYAADWKGSPGHLQFHKSDSDVYSVLIDKAEFMSLKPVSEEEYLSIRYNHVISVDFINRKKLNV